MSPATARADTPVIGACWAGAPVVYSCVNNWEGPGQYFEMAVIDRTSQINPAWDDGQRSATDAWLLAPGPIIAYYIKPDSSLNTVDMMRTSLNYSRGGEHDLVTKYRPGQLPVGLFGITERCDRDLNCDNTNRPWPVEYVKIYLNHDLFDAYNSGTRFRHVVAHELGHALGLAERNDLSRSVMSDKGYEQPQPDDVGNVDFCTNQYGPRGGVRCVYKSIGAV